MPLESAVCPHCGAPLQVNPQAERLICRYCGNEFIVEEAIKKYNLNIKDSVIHNNFNGATFYVQGNTDEENKATANRTLKLKIVNTLILGGSWEFFVDNKSVCSMMNGEWTLKISEEEHIVQAKLYGEGLTQVTNYLEIKPGQSPLCIVAKNRIFSAPIIKLE